MIKLAIYHLDSNFQSFRLEGHSSIGKKGNNLLCAGVSTLVQTMILGIMNVLEINIHLEKQDGYILCNFPDNLNQKENEGINLLMMTMIVGFQDLEKQFPNEIQIEWLSK